MPTRSIRIIGMAVALAHGAVFAGCHVHYGQDPHGSRAGSSKAAIEGDEIRIKEAISFAHDSAEIHPSSFQLIADIADVMKRHDDIDFVEIAGHASKTGDADYNLALTQRRASSVMIALVDQGVAYDRMRAVGYGFYCELKPGDDDSNRRVEFKILRRAGRDTGVKGGGCEAADARGLGAKPIPSSAPSSR